MKKIWLGLCAFGVIANGGRLLAHADSAVGQTAKAELKKADGTSAGTVRLEETPHGILVTADFENLAPGSHAFHVHEVGKCEAPFKTAGGHFNPTAKKHGIKNVAGKHAGDMPNVVIGADGKGDVQFFLTEGTLGAGKDSLTDGKGTSIVVHATADDYTSDPSGNAGDRIACGVISK